jgi:hypothetical protein
MATDGLVNVVDILVNLIGLSLVRKLRSDLTPADSIVMTEHWGQPPVAAQLPKKHRVRNIVLGVVGGFCVIGIIGSLAGGGDETATVGINGGDALTAESPAPSESANGSVKTLKSGTKPKPAKPRSVLPVAARDGKFEFKVTKLKTGVKKIGDQYVQTKAQGQFVIVSITVKNIGDEARTFDAGSQKAYDQQGREFSADSTAGIYLDDSNSFLTGINPGNSVKGQVVFDIPKGTQLAQMELHDSAFSGGVKVAVN